MHLDVFEHRSCLIKFSDSIDKVAIADDSPIVPVKISPTELLAHGGKPGEIRFRVTSGSEHVDFNAIVKKANSLESELKNLVSRMFHGFKNDVSNPVRKIQSVRIDLSEIPSRFDLDLPETQARLFSSEAPIVRTAVSDPRIADVIFLSGKAFYLRGKHPGNTTVLLWDQLGNATGIDLAVSSSQRRRMSVKDGPTSATRDSACTPRIDAELIPPVIGFSTHEIESWQASRKTICAVLSGNSDVSADDLDHADYNTRLTVITLNNEGVEALNQAHDGSGYELAIHKLKESLSMDPTYQVAIKNLAIACNNYGLHLREQKKVALKWFHMASFLDPENTTTECNLAGLIRTMHRNSRDFDVRMQLAEEASASGDLAGAVVEYSAALKLRADVTACLKLQDAMKALENAYYRIHRNDPPPPGPSKSLPNNAA